MSFSRVTAAFLFLASLSYANVINFDNLSNGTVVTGQYAPIATFSSVFGEAIVTYNYSSAYGGSAPNFICTAGSFNALTQDCSHSVFVDFTNPVDGLTFHALGVDNTGMVAQVNVFENYVFGTSVGVFGLGTPFTPLAVDLSAYTNVTRIEIVNVTDFSGIGYDDFSFSVAASPTPEPSSLALLFGGIGALLLRARRVRSGSTPNSTERPSENGSPQESVRTSVFMRVFETSAVR